MRKLKRIIPFLLACILSIAVPLAACGGGNEDEKDKTVLQSVVLNTDNVKKDYNYGEAFTSDGLAVTAVVLPEGAETPEERTLSAEEYTVDSSSFNSLQFGKYTINVSYTLNGVTKDAQYEVTVVQGQLRIEVDTSNVKKRFFIGDKFTSEGLVVKAFIGKPDSTETEEKILTSGEYTVDSSNFNGRREGTYKVTVSYTYNGMTRSFTYDVSVIALIDRIELDLTNVKTKFFTDSQQTDAFTTEGLQATAYIWNSTTGELESRTLKYEDLVIDASAYKEEIGFYNIVVSYTYENVKRSATYEVAHLASSDGLEVTLADGVEDTYTLSADLTEIEIDVSKIVVKETDRDGTVSSEITDYEVKLYKGGEEIPLNGTKANVQAGAYNILVLAESDRTPGFVRSGFAVIYVNDDLVNFVLADGTFEQDSGLDIISDTWGFTATYASGATRTITAKDCVYELDTMTVAKDKPLTITYTDVNAKGGKVTKILDVTYTINKVYGKIEYTFDYSAIGKTEDNVPLAQSDLNGVNAFLQLADGTATYRNKTANAKVADCIEVKEKGLSVRFEGTGFIKVGFSSTGPKNESAVGLVDASGTYVAATYEESNDIRVFDKIPNVYVVTGTIEQVFTFKVTKPGVYSITSPAKDAGINRGCRVYSIAMEDNVDDPSKIICNVDFTDTAKFKVGTLVASSATAPVQIKDTSGNETGLSITKSHNPMNTNKIAKVDGVNVLQLQGAVSTTRNSLLFNAVAGKLKVTVKYFETAGRYIDILNADGTVVATSSAYPTTDNKFANVIECTLTLDVASDTVLYLGSHGGPINIAYLKVEKA